MNTHAQGAPAPVVFPYSTSEVRVFIIDGAPWFVATDVCSILEIGNATMALRRLDEDEKATLNSIESRPGQGPQELNIINESGLYALILTSRKPEAKKFKKWVTAEVLPAIRRTGHYELAPPARQPIRTREDLSFTRRDPEGRFINWCPERYPQLWEDGLALGEAYFKEVEELAAHDERAAYFAIRFALSGEWEPLPGGDSRWRKGGWGIECGFALALAKSVIMGLRTRRDGGEPYDPDAPKPKRRALPKPGPSKALPASPVLPAAVH